MFSLLKLYKSPMKATFILFTGLFFIFSVPVAQPLTKTEKKIVAKVELHFQEALHFLEETVNINSGTHNLEGIQKVGQLYEKPFSKLGFETRWVSMPEEMHRAGHFFAEHKGSKGKKLLLIGHLDTVFEPTGSDQKFSKQDTVAFGPGSNDMKGGNMILLFALKALKEAGVLEKAQIIVALHGDEESTGKPLSISRKDILDAAKRSDVALGFETATGFHYATVARRGSSGWVLRVSGKQAHSSGVFGNYAGAGAIYEASRILTDFYTLLQEENLTFNPGLMLGGTAITMDTLSTAGTVSGKTNVVAREVVVKGDLRFISEEQKERTRKKMQAIVSRNLPQTSAEISFTDSYPAMPPTAGNFNLLKILNEVSLALGQGEVKPYDPGRRGAGDISFVAEYVDCLDGLGAMGGGAHSPGEYIALNSLEPLIKRTALLIYRLLQN